MSDPSDEPLIYTVRGNVPVSSLEHYIGWEVTDTYVKFREEYRFKDDGSLAREDAHVRILKSPGTESQQGSFG